MLEEMPPNATVFFQDRKGNQSEINYCEVGNDGEGNEDSEEEDYLPPSFVLLGMETIIQ